MCQESNYESLPFGTPFMVTRSWSSCAQFCSSCTPLHSIFFSPLFVSFDMHVYTSHSDQGWKFPRVQWSMATRTSSGPVEHSLPLACQTCNFYEKCQTFSQCRNKTSLSVWLVIIPLSTFMSRGHGQPNCDLFSPIES